MWLSSETAITALNYKEKVMSDLRYQTVEQLKESLASCQKYIRELETKLNGQRVREEWIKKYIFEKTPVEMTLDQIEARLGHKVIFKK